MANIDGLNFPVLNDTDYVDKFTSSGTAIDNHDHSSSKGLPVALVAAGVVTDANMAVVPGNAGKFLVRNGSGAVVSNTKDVPTGTVVGTSDSQTLTNKILNGNTAVTLISGSGTLTLNTTGTATVPNATDTLVGKATTDTLTNKTLTGNTAVNLISGSGTIIFPTSGTVTVPSGTDTIVTKTSTDTLTNKTLTTPNMTSPVVITGPVTIPEQATPATPANGFGKIYFKSDGLLYQLNDSGVETTAGSSTGALFTSRNFLDNAQFRYSQKNFSGLGNLANGAGNIDRWYMLGSVGNNQGNGAVEESATGFQTRYAGQFRTAGGGGPQQYGTCQIVEANESFGLRGKDVTFTFAARTDGTEVTTLRAGIVEWTGTTDNPTRNIVSSWSSTPTLIANATFVNTPSDLTISSSWAQFSITATLGTTLKNLIVFIWTPNAEADNDDFYLKEAQLVKGVLAPAFEVTEISAEADLARCQRFYEKSYDTNVDPTTSSTVGSEIIIGAVTATADPCKVPFKVNKFKIPSMILYSTTGAAAKVRHNDAAADVSATAVGIGQTGYAPEFSVTSAHTYGWHWAADANIGT